MIVEAFNRLRLEPHRGDGAKRAEQHEDDELGDQERHLRLRRRQGLQETDFQEGLHHQYEHIEIERQQRAADIDPAPDAGELVDIEREQSRQQHGQRNEAENLGGKQRRERDREHEPGDAGQHRGEEEDRGPSVVLSTVQHVPRHYQAGADGDQADDHVQQGESLDRHSEDHDRPPI